MKKLLVLIFIGFAAISPALYSENDIYGFADMDKIYEESISYQETKIQFQELVKKYNEYVLAKNLELQTAGPEEATIINEALKNRTMNLDIGADNINNKRSQLSDRFKEVIRDIGKKHNIGLVFLNTDSVVISGKYEDLTDEVIKKINEDK